MKQRGGALVEHEHADTAGKETDDQPARQFASLGSVMQRMRGHLDPPAPMGFPSLALSASAMPLLHLLSWCAEVHSGAGKLLASLRGGWTRIGQPLHAPPSSP